MAILKSTKFKRKSWIEDENGNMLTPKFKMNERAIKTYEDWVYIPYSSIGAIVYHIHKDEIILMEYETNMRIGDFRLLIDNLYVAYVRSEKAPHARQRLYNEKGEFLGEVEDRGYVGVCKLETLSYEGGIHVIKDGKKYLVNNWGEVR